MYSQAFSNYPESILSRSNHCRKSVNRDELSNNNEREQEGAYCLYNDAMSHADAQFVVRTKESCSNTRHISLIDTAITSVSGGKIDQPLSSVRSEGLPVEEIQIHRSTKGVPHTSSSTCACCELETNLQVDRQHTSRGTKRACESQNIRDLIIENSVENYQIDIARHILHVESNIDQEYTDKSLESDEQNSTNIQFPSDNLSLQRSDNNSRNLSALSSEQELKDDECPPPTYRSLIELIIEDGPPSYETVTGERVPYDEVMLGAQ